MTETHDGTVLTLNPSASAIHYRASGSRRQLVPAHDRLRLHLSSVGQHWFGVETWGDATALTCTGPTPVPTTILKRNGQRDRRRVFDNERRSDFGTCFAFVRRVLGFGTLLLKRSGCCKSWISGTRGRAPLPRRARSCHGERVPAGTEPVARLRALPRTSATLVVSLIREKGSREGSIGPSILRTMSAPLFATLFVMPRPPGFLRRYAATIIMPFALACCKPDTRPHGNAFFQSITFSADGSRMVTGDDSPSSSVRVVDPHTGQILHSFVAFARELLISDDARLVVVAGRAPLSYDVLDLDSGSVVGVVPHLNEFATRLLGFTPGGRELVVAKDNLVTVWDFREQQAVRTIPVDARANRWGATRSPDGRYFALQVQQSLVASLPFLLDVERGSLVPIPFQGRWVQGFAFSSDGTMLAIGGHDDIELHDLASGTVRHTASCPNPRNQTLDPKRFSSDDRMLVAEGDRGQVCAFDVGDGHLVGSGNSEVRSGYDHLSVSLDASRVVVQRSNDHYEIWSSVPTAHLIDVVPDHVSSKGRITRAHALSADGSLLFMSDQWGAGAWDTRTGKRRFVMND